MTNMSVKIVEFMWRHGCVFSFLTLSMISDKNITLLQKTGAKQKILM
jgi:hypothetical protein